MKYTEDEILGKLLREMVEGIELFGALEEAGYKGLLNVTIAFGALEAINTLQGRLLDHIETCTPEDFNAAADSLNACREKYMGQCLEEMEDFKRIAKQILKEA